MVNNLSKFLNSKMMRNIFFILLLSLFLLQGGHSSKASTVIKAADSTLSEQKVVIVEDCGSLSEPDTLYQLSGDLISPSYGCFAIEAPNITLDCMGHEITSTTGGGDGVYISGDAEGATVSNCHLNNFWRGIYVNNTPYFTAENNYIESVSFCGIWVTSSPHSVLRQNQIVNAGNQATPLFMLLSDYSVVEKNRSENNVKAVSISSSNISFFENIIDCFYGHCLNIEGDSMVIKNNLVSALGDYSNDGLSLKGSNNILEANTIKSTWGSGIRVQGYFNRLEGNVVSTKGPFGPTIGGIYIGDLTGRGSDNTLINNRVNGEFSVALFITSARNQVINNKAVGKNGLFISRDTENIVTGNTIHALDPSVFALYIAGSNHRIYNNIIIGEKWVSNIGFNLALSYNSKGNRYILQDGTEAYQLYDLVDVTNDNQADIGLNYPLEVGNSDGRFIGFAQDFHPYTKTQNPKFSNFRLQALAEPPVGGIVTGSNFSMRYGQVATLKAVANPGYQFVSWSTGMGDCPSQSGPTRGTLYATMDPVSSIYCNFLANFEPIN